jgi:hypothetical protein
MSVMKHTHKYERRKLGKNSHIVFVCVLPGCSHNVSEELVKGRKSICWVCGEEFIVTKPRKNPIPKRPHCLTCTRKPDKSHVKPITDLNPLEIFDELIDGVDND